jgi:hypothetical protein
MHKYTFAILAAISSTILYSSLDGKCYAQSNVLQTEIQGFFLTNVPVSHAICLLAKRSPIPIDAVIDDWNDPLVTISVERATIGAILRELLAHHPNHGFREESGTILVLPDSLFHREVPPLTKRLSKFNVTYQSYQMRGRERYACVFYLLNNPQLNIDFAAVLLSQKPNYSAFPHVRTFENQSIVDILTAISKEGAISFYCYRMDPSFVKARNKDADDEKKATWWPNPDAPCYSVIWGTNWYGERPSQ